MKRALFLLCGICLLIAQLGYAQGTKKKKPQPKVPPVVLEAFAAKYPATKATDWDWEPEKEIYEAEFMQDGKERDAAFSPAGKWLKTKTDITQAELPETVSKAAAASQYSTWQMTEFSQIESADKGIYYKIRFKNGQQEQSLKFDANGNQMEMKKDARKAPQKS